MRLLVKGPLQTPIIKIDSHYSSYAEHISERDLQRQRFGRLIRPDFHLLGELKEPVNRPTEPTRLAFSGD